MDPDGTGTRILTDEVRLTVSDVDGDVDSDNTKALRAGPDATRPEDQIEFLENAPGKIIPLNNQNTDGDSPVVPDHADGFRVILNSGTGFGTASANASAGFTPLDVTIPAPIDLTKATLKFTYSASDPAALNPVNLTPGTGLLRIWTEDGDAGRRGELVGTPISGGADFGDWVKPGVTISASDLGFDPARKATLFVEGISAGHADIGIELVPDAGAPTFHDKLQVTVTSSAIQGTITYDDTAPKAVRGALVKAWDSVTGPDTFLGSAYTDDNGNYTTLSQYTASDIYIRVYPHTRPYGNGLDNVKRSINVDPGISEGVTAYYHQFSPPTGTTLASGATVSINTEIGDDAPTANNHRAFWAFDAGVTASRFHARLPGVTPGSFEIEYPALSASTSYAHLGEVNLVETDFNKWDTIIHEYGHLVAQDEGFFEIPYNALLHIRNVNSRLLHSDSAFDKVQKLAWNEGWADFYSVIAQEVEGVSSPAVSSGNDTAGDGKYKTNNAETTVGKGEDEELSVMTILWDLYDDEDDGESIAMGIDGLFTFLDTHDPLTIESVWNKLLANAPDFAAKLEYATIFEAHNVSPKLKGAIGPAGGAPDKNITLPAASLPPELQWVIPTAPAIGSYPATGHLLNRFGIKFFDQNGTQIFDSGFLTTGSASGELQITGDDASFIPKTADWSTIKAGRLGTPLTWVVYGGHAWFEGTAKYWSSAGTVTPN